MTRSGIWSLTGLLSNNKTWPVTTRTWTHITVKLGELVEAENVNSFGALIDKTKTKTTPRHSTLWTRPDYTFAPVYRCYINVSVHIN